MKKLLSSVFPQFLLVLSYLVLACFVWKSRATIIALLPLTDASIPFYALFDIAMQVGVFAILLLGLIGIMRLALAPPLLRTRFTKAVIRSGLCNHLGECPKLRAATRDCSKKHGKKLFITTAGLSITDFDSHTLRLEISLNAHIYHYEIVGPSVIAMYLIPRKYMHPAVISSDYTQLCQLPNCLVVGATGSGKSYALFTILGIYAKHIPNVAITVCDYKKSSFAQFSDTPNFYGYEDAVDGIKKIYEEFSERLKANDEERNAKIHLLVVDEYAALIASQEKKTADELKTMVANMLFMGRSLGIRVLIGVQRADAEHFKAGARDQFRAILALGNISKEQKQMLFPDFRNAMTERNGVGEGYLLIDGHELERVKVAQIEDFDELSDSIRKAMHR